MADNLLSEMRKLFNMAQDGVVASKLCNMMEDIQKNNNEDAFYAGFINHLQKAMVFYNAATCVERVMEFAAAFTTFATIKKQKEAKEGDSMASELEDDVTEVFLANILKFLVQNHNSRDKAVRYRCCQLINKILNCMGEDAMIDEDLSDSIYECMMIRIKDRSPRIRIQAVLALVRLQDPEDEECPVIDAFLHSMRTDGNADVRRTIVANIALSRKTLPYVIGRTRDVKDSNRKSAFLTLAEKVSIRAFTIAQRVKLLSVGLKDRSNAVKQACGQMVKAWLRSYNQDIFKLLEAIDLEESVECAENLIDYILKEALPEKLQEYIKLVKDLGEETNGPVKLVTFDKLTPEISYFWYMLCKHLIGMGENGELMLQQLLPELTNFCEYIKLYAERNFIDSAIITAFNGDESGTQEFILEYLLKIAGLLDFSDEVGRKNLKSLVHDLLVAETMPLSLASVLVERYINAESDENKFVTDLVETIADIKQPLVQVVTTAMKENNRRNELKLARIRVAINECQEDLDNAVKSNDFHQAAVLKEQMTSHEKEKESLLDEMNMGKINEPQRVEKDDPETMLKCMTVASSMLYHVRKSAHLAKSSTLLTLKDELIFEGIKNEDPFIRNEAIKCLGHISLISKDFAAQHLVLFLQVAQVDQELLQITSVNTIFDLFLMYGLEAFNTEQPNSKKNEESNNEEDTTMVSQEEQEETEGNKTNIEEEEGENEEPTIIEETPPEEQKSNAGNAAESVLEIMVMFLEGESPDLRTSVAEGMAKLLISGRIVSAKILTRLILLWYNPITEDDIKLRHCIGVFLPLFSFENRSHQEIYEETFLPVLKTLLNAPTSSPLSRVDVTNVVDLLIQLTDVRNLVQFNVTTDTSQNNLLNSLETHVHDSLAMRLANEILSDPEDPDVKLFCKTLTQLAICPKNVATIRDLIELSSQITEVFEGNRVAKKSIEKFQSTLERLLIDGGGSMSSTGQESQDATVPPAVEANSTPIADLDSGARNNTLTDTDADKTLTETENELPPNKHKLSSSSEKIASKSKRSKIQDSRVSSASVDFRVNPKDSTVEVEDEDEEMESESESEGEEE